MASNARQYVTGGQGSTLDADFLDSLTSTQFLRSDTSDTFDGDLIITGDLTVSGTTTTVDSENVLIADNILTLNSNYVGDTPSENAGIEVNRGGGLSLNTLLRWNETTDNWQLTNDGTNFYEIMTSNTSLDNEQIEDIIGTKILGTGGITVSYDDPSGFTTIDAANAYTHPTHPGDDINLDTGTLSGATVISDITWNITTDTLGHVTDATLTTLTTRDLTAANVGALAVGGTAVDSDKVDGQHAHEMSWGHLTPLVTYNDFNTFTNTDKFGGHFVNGTTNGPGTNAASAYYHTRYSLGSDYNNYGAQLAFGRNVTTPYISIRFEENSIQGAWQKISAGYADDAGTAGVAGTADIWTTARTITLGGDLTGNVSIDGSQNVTLTATVVNDSHTHSEYLLNNADDTTTGNLTITRATAPTFTVETSATSSQDATIKIRGARTASATSNIAMIEFDNKTSSPYTMGQIATQDPNADHTLGDGRLIFRTSDNKILSDVLTLNSDKSAVFTGSVDATVLNSVTLNMTTAGVINFDVAAGSVSKITGRTGGLDLHSDSTIVFKETDSDVAAVTVSTNDKSVTAVTFIGTLTAPLPTTPTTFSSSIIGETIEVQFAQSVTANCDRHELWSSLDNIEFNPISAIPKEDFTATISIIDDTFYTAGTIYYRVYAIKNGLYSVALTGSQIFTAPTLDVANLAVAPTLEGYELNYDYPISRFYTGVEIWMDADAVQGSLLRANASLIYSGPSDNYYYNVVQTSTDYYQFWVEII